MQDNTQNPSEVQDEWRPISTCADYEVSDRGRVRRMESGRVLVLQRQRKGYTSVRLKDKWYLVHRLVAVAFLGDSPPERLCVNHKNSVKTDNNVGNLEWCSARENTAHAMNRAAAASIRWGATNPAVGRDNAAAKLQAEDIPIIRGLRGNVRLSDIASRFGVSEDAILSIYEGKTWGHVSGAKALALDVNVDDVVQWAHGEGVIVGKVIALVAAGDDPHGVIRQLNHGVGKNSRVPDLAHVTLPIPHTSALVEVRYESKSHPRRTYRVPVGRLTISVREGYGPAGWQVVEP